MFSTSMGIGSKSERIRLFYCNVLGAFILLTLANFLIFLFIYLLFQNLENKEEQTNINAAIEVGIKLTQHDLETVASNLEFLSNTEVIKKFSPLNGSLDAIEREFLNVAKSSNYYDQVRLIGPSGMELVRVDYNQGDPSIVPTRLLQNKSNRYYFLNTAKITDESIYISPLDLNMEGGEVEIPLKPMIRFGKPLRDDSGNLKGVIVLNYLGSIFLDKFREQMAVAPGDFFLINADGYWLSNPDHELEWGFALDHHRNFREQHPEAWQALKSSDKGIIKIDKVAFSYSTIHPISQLSQRVSNTDHQVDNWKIISIKAYSNVNPEILMNRLQFLFPIFIFYPLSLFLSWKWVKESIDKRRSEFNIRALNTFLEDKVKERTLELGATQDITIFCMATLAETRDNETGQHIRRTQNYVKLLATHLRKHEYLTDDTIELLYKSAPLHDIGKVGIPDNILLKPGKLSPDEFEIMKKHATYGSEAIRSAINNLEQTLIHKSGATFLQFAQEITYCHHEKWDGSGYPNGISGNSIPLSARIMAVADVFDALSCKRVYKKAFSREVTRELMIKGAGFHFDPRIIDAFIELEDEFWKINQMYAESSEYSLQEAFYYQI